MGYRAVLIKIFYQKKEEEEDIIERLSHAVRCTYTHKQKSCLVKNTISQFNNYN